MGTPIDPRRGGGARTRRETLTTAPTTATTTTTTGPRLRGGGMISGTGGPDWVGRSLTFDTSRNGISPNSSYDDSVLRESTPIADRLLEQAKEEGARKELEEELLLGIKDDLRRLANKLDADNWMYSSLPLPFRM